MTSHSKAQQIITLIQDEKLALPDYTDFCKKVSAAYMARPKFEQAAVPAFKELAKHSDKIFKQIKSKIDVEFVDEDPYKNFDELQADIKNNKRMKIWKGESDHPVLTPEQNWRLRAVHDWFAHTLGQHRFTMRGEIASYNRHAKLAPPKAHPAIFTEVVGQVCAFLTTGKFQEQKVALLYGFDLKNVGMIDEEEYKKNFE